jgi:hypothetical protein
MTDPVRIISADSHVWHRNVAARSRRPVSL